MKMNGKFLLDTSIVVAMFGGDNSIAEHLIYPNRIFIPSIVIGELYFGAYKSERVIKNLSQVEEFIANNSVLYCDVKTAKEYGLIKNELRKKGSIIPDNDIWIAAIAKQYDLILATRDNHFINLDDLIELEIW